VRDSYWVSACLSSIAHGKGIDADVHWPLRLGLVAFFVEQDSIEEGKRRLWVA
jgi:hypothetical protein